MSSGQMMEEAPSWDELCFAARVPALRLEFFDSSQVSSARRLKYEEFEELFYQLLLLIDPKETKRRLKKSRWQEERARFIDSLTRLVNENKLVSKKVTTSQFKTYGGEAFRRLLGALMKSACDRQATLLRTKRLNSNLNNNRDVRPPAKRLIGQMRSNSVQEGSDKLEASEIELKELRNKLAKLRARRSELKRDDEGFGIHGQDSVQEMDMCNQLLSRLERAASETNGAYGKLHKIELPAMNRIKAQEQRGQSEWRLSQFIREVKARSNPNRDHEGESGDAGKSLGDRISRQMGEYDEKMSQLLDKLHLEADHVDEMMLKNPEILERFKRLEQVLPNSKFSPIVATPGIKVEAPDVEALAKVLARFPDSNCDDQQALEVYRNVLDKRLKKRP